MRFSEYTPNWADWAPDTVVAHWEENFREHLEVCEFGKSGDERLIKSIYYDEPSILSLLERILTKPEMETVWRKVEKLNIKPELFSSTIQLAYLGPQGIERKTISEKKKWAKRVEKLSIELADLLEYTDLDDYLFKEYKMAHTKFIMKQAAIAVIDPKCSCDGKSSVCRLNITYRPPNISEILRELPHVAHKHENGNYNRYMGGTRNNIPLPRPGKDESSHLYFIRYLTKFFLNSTEGKNCFREYVKICVETAYGRKFTTRQIEKIAPKNSLL